MKVSFSSQSNKSPFDAYSEVQRAADRASEDTTVKVSVSDVHETFANAKMDAQSRAEKLVDAFCEGQRKYYKYLTARRGSEQGLHNQNASRSIRSKVLETLKSK